MDQENNVAVQPTADDLIVRLEAIQEQRNNALDMCAVMQGSLKLALLRNQSLEKRITELETQLAEKDKGE